MQQRSASTRSPEPAPTQRGRIRAPLLWILGSVVAGIGLYSLVGFYGGPWLVDRWLVQYGSSAPGRAASRETVRFNPFTLIGAIEGIEIRDDDTVLRAENLVLDFAAQSLIERRFVFDSISIERAQIDVGSMDDLTALAARTRDRLLRRTRVEHLDLIDSHFSAAAGSDRHFELSGIALTLTALDGQTEDSAGFSLNAVTSTGASIAVDGTLAANLEYADGQLRLGGLELSAIAARLGSIISDVDPRGRVDVATEFSSRALLSSPTTQLTDAHLEFIGLALTPAADLNVNVERATASATLLFANDTTGTALRGRMEASLAPLLIRDERVSPPQSFAFDDAALLTNVDPHSGELSLVLGGRLRQAGAASVTARVSPAATQRSVSIDAADVPATMLSAYAAGALRRRLAAGTINLGIEYSISGNRTEGSTRVTARSLAFAEQAADVESDGGTAELAAALLENSDGIIEMDLRFASNTANVRDAVNAALTARINTVTQTPFVTLAPLIDATAQTANAVPFLPGDAALNDLALASVAALANAMNARPRLGIRISGGFDASVDRDALARQQIALHVQLATAGESAQDRAAQIDFDSPRVRDVLDEFAGERLQAERIAELAERFQCEGALAPVCEHAYYEQAFDALVANEAIGPRTLSRLGRFRAQSIIDALRQRGVADERIQLVAGSNVVDTPLGVGLPVELTALATQPRSAASAGQDTPRE